MSSLPFQLRQRLTVHTTAVTSEFALDILFEEAKQGRVDGALLNLFRDAEIFRLASTRKSP